MTPIAHSEIPLAVKEQLVAISEKLPSQHRNDFLKATSDQIAKVANAYENTIVYGVAGWILGQIVDTHLPIINWIVPDNVSEISATIGALVGYRADAEKRKRSQAIAEEISAIVRQEFSKLSSN